MLRSQRDLYSLICGRRRSFTQIPKIKKEKKETSFWGEHRDIDVRRLLLALRQQRALKLQRLKTFSFLRSWCWIVSRGAKDRLNQRAKLFSFWITGALFTQFTMSIHFLFTFNILSIFFFFLAVAITLSRKKILSPMYTSAICGPWQSVHCPCDVVFIIGRVRALKYK